jgi:hypothetical protein
VVIDKDLPMKSRIREDYIALQQAEPDMIKTIAYLLAQTVALHFYEMCARPFATLQLECLPAVQWEVAFVILSNCGLNGRSDLVRMLLPLCRTVRHRTR